jgi:hypothetical protein
MLDIKPFQPEELKAISLDSTATVRLKPTDIEHYSRAIIQRVEHSDKPNSEEYRLADAQAKRLWADECLVRTPDNLYIVYSHAGFESYWNCLAPEVREYVKVIRPFWFGLCGNRLDFKIVGARTQIEIDEFISKRLIESIKKQIGLYKEKAMVCNFYRDKITGKQIPKDDVNFREAFVSNFNGVGLEYSTYKLALIKALAGEGAYPEIPEDSLSKAEYDELKKEFTPAKLKENK